jgi:hypothetical protein
MNSMAHKMICMTKQDHSGNNCLQRTPNPAIARSGAAEAKRYACNKVSLRLDILFNVTFVVFFLYLGNFIPTVVTQLLNNSLNYEKLFWTIFLFILTFVGPYELTYKREKYKTSQKNLFIKLLCIYVVPFLIGFAGFMFL